MRGLQKNGQVQKLAKAQQSGRVWLCGDFAQVFLDCSDPLTMRAIGAD